MNLIWLLADLFGQTAQAGGNRHLRPVVIATPGR